MKLTEYERGYLDGQRSKESGAQFFAGNVHYASAPPHTQGFIDGYGQTQGRIEDPR